MNIISNSMTENVKPDLVLRKSGRIARQAAGQHDVARQGVGRDQDATSVLGRLVSQEILRARHENSEDAVNAQAVQQTGETEYAPPSDAAIDFVFARMSGFFAVG